MDGRGVEFSFDDNVGFFEPFGDIAFLEDKMLGNVRVF